MIVFEYRLESFNTLGSDGYIDGFAEHLDRLFVNGWRVFESTRDPHSAGWWRVELVKEARLRGASARI